MKKIVLLLVVAAFAFTTASAQKKPTKVIDNKGTIKWVLDTSTALVSTAKNGLTKLNDTTFILGGALDQVTTLDINGQKLQLANLIGGTGTDSLVVADPTTGELKRISASRLLQNLVAENGLTKTGDVVRLGGALNQATTISATAANNLTLASGGEGSLKITGLTSGQVGDSILVVDPATNNIRYISKSKLLDGLTANNGLTKIGDNIELGGALTKATVVTTTAANTLAVAGLQSGNLATDSIVVADATTGVLKRVSAASLLQSGDEVFTATTGVLTFTVANLPAIVSRVWVFRNGAKLVANEDYTVSGTTVTLIQNDYTLTTGDKIEVQWVK
jgi:hypothetical protein